MELNSDCNTSRVLRLGADSTVCMCIYVLKTQITPFWHENPFIILIFQQMFRLIDVRRIRVPHTIPLMQFSINIVTVATNAAIIYYYLMHLQ